jgi:hypothetical protein
MSALLLAVICLIAASILGWIFKRPRQWLLGLLGRWVYAIRWRMYLDRRSQTQLAIDRTTDILAQQLNRGDGNPSDKLYTDWLNWLRAEPGAADPYDFQAAHQQRMLDQAANYWKDAKLRRNQNTFTPGG